ncbi:MAG: protein-glutamate O-methyltransferase CheR [Pseudomonadales bacterium]|nr:protein-glutamate O-methyltransferase CheR [Pseudomonadales bacterium]
MGSNPTDLYFTKEDYRVFQEFLQKACGIVLGENKQYLVANRIRRILLDEQVKTLTELVQRIQRGSSMLKERVIDAMTTNETFWFRDGQPFDVLRDILLPRLLKAGRGEPLQIWSAACSSGQEPYSISMIIEEFKALNPGVLRQEPRIIATDISATVLAAANQGRYDRLSISRGLSDDRRKLFFKEEEDGYFTLLPKITDRVEFRSQNLLESFNRLGKFDLVFCRNVLIYFASAVRSDILHRIAANLKPGASLILGSSEAMPAGLDSHYRLERLNSSVSVYNLR